MRQGRLACQGNRHRHTALLPTLSTRVDGLPTLNQLSTTSLPSAHIFSSRWMSLHIIDVQTLCGQLLVILPHKVTLLLQNLPACGHDTLHLL